MNRQLKKCLGFLSNVFNKVCELMAEDNNYSGKNDLWYNRDL